MSAADIAARSTIPEAGKAVDATKAEIMAEKIAEHLEIDWDGDEPFVRADSIEAGVCAALASVPAPSGAVVDEILAADAAKPEASFDNVNDMLNWLDRPQAVPAEDVASQECPVGIKPEAAQFCSAGTCVHCALHRSEAEAASLRRKLEEHRKALEAARGFLHSFIVDTDPIGLIVPEQMEANVFTSAWDETNEAVRSALSGESVIGSASTIDAMREACTWLEALVAEAAPGSEASTHEVVITITKLKAAIARIRMSARITEAMVEAGARAAFDTWWANRGAGYETSWLSTKQQWLDQARSCLTAALSTEPGEAEGLSEWCGWDQSRPPWGECKHKDAVLEALFRAPWSVEDAATLIGFIERTWPRAAPLPEDTHHGR